MVGSIFSSSDSSSNDRKKIGVRFAESTVGKPIISALLYITSSFWLTFIAVGVLLVLMANVVLKGLLAGILGVFGLSSILIGLLGHTVYKVVTYRAEKRG